MDTINIEVLEDGRLKITTDQVSAANHRNADELLKLLAELMGGEVDTQKRRDAQVRHQQDRQLRIGG